jgi:cytochrome c
LLPYTGTAEGLFPPLVNQLRIGNIPIPTSVMQAAGGHDHAECVCSLLIRRHVLFPTIRCRGIVMLNTRTRVLLFIIPLVIASNADAGGDAVRGQTLYQTRCTVCHSIEYNGMGPAHKGVYGRKAGRAPDFPYSEALKNSTVVWNEQTLDRWLANPEQVIPGQRMGVSVADEKDRADLIAYLKKISGR